MTHDNQLSSRTLDSDSEKNKQEENLIKVLAAASDSTNASLGDFAVFSICNFILMACGICISTMLFMLYIDEGDLVVENAPQITYLYSTVSSLSSLSLTVNDMYASVNDHIIETEEFAKKKERMEYYISRLAQYYNHVRYGVDSIPPYTLFQEYSEKAFEKSSCDYTVPPTTIEDSIACFTTDSLIRYIVPQAYRIMYPLANSEKSKHKEFDSFWLSTAYKLYDDFFYPASVALLPYVDDQVAKKIPVTIYVCVIALVVGFITSILLIMKAKSSSARLLYTLQLLMNVPNQTLMQNQNILQILSGDFSKSKDNATRDQQFYEALVYDLPDSIIICDNLTNIVSVNKITATIFEQDLTGKNMIQFIESDAFIGEKSSITNMTVRAGQADLQYAAPSGEKKMLSISMSVTQSQCAYSIRNVTQTYQYNRLISDEKAKSDRLLMSILPASLVPRVQSGEKNVSFSVQSASVVFIDIVEFTPWCGSNTASKITGVLNAIFREFDTIINSLQSMLRIKCIGDCYMAAGGIFSELSQPAQNAKEAVDFGLRAIEAIGQLNERLGESLRVRVGSHVGGPIVAGVIGIEKPTFEIFGPTINMAQQMEHNGVPMKVHVSRTVYELIYGGSYKIEERGQIQLKHGPAVTYLVTQ